MLRYKRITECVSQTAKKRKAKTVTNTKTLPESWKKNWKTLRVSVITIVVGVHGTVSKGMKKKKTGKN